MAVPIKPEMTLIKDSNPHWLDSYDSGKLPPTQGLWAHTPCDASMISFPRGTNQVQESCDVPKKKILESV